MKNERRYTKLSDELRSVLVSGDGTGTGMYPIDKDKAITIAKRDLIQDGREKEAEEFVEKAKGYQDDDKFMGFLTGYFDFKYGWP